jgi:hypothetical protein
MVCMATPNVWISKKSSEVLVAAEDPVIIGSSWARSTLPYEGEFWKHVHVRSLGFGGPPREGVPKRIAGLARAYRGPLSIPRRCPLSVVKQRCGSASPGLNRVFRLLPQRLEVLLHQWPRPTDLPRVRCVGRGRQHPRQRC